MNLAGKAKESVGQARRLAERAAIETRSAAVMVRAGALAPTLPHNVAKIGLAFAKWGPTGAAITVAAAHHPKRTAVIDELGTLTFDQLDKRSNALANELRARGVDSSSTVGILCRNHRGMFDALFATAKLGARTLLLNTDFSGPQLADVSKREGVQVLIHDEEYAGIVGGVDAPLGRFVAWTDTDSDAPTIEKLIATGSRKAPPRAATKQKIILLTSGTTGTPKGAPRDLGASLAVPGAFLSRIPMRSGGATYVAAPVFHTWGLAGSIMSMSLGNTVIVRRKFDAVAVLDTLEDQECDALVTVPILLSRLLDADDEGMEKRNFSSLRIVALAGSALGAELGTRAMDVFGDVVYNIYGSTEVAYASIATPADLRLAPGTTGRPPIGTVVRLFDDNGKEVPKGATGRIFVGNGSQFEGYTGGGTKEVLEGLMSSGDVGHFDENGLLFVDGRDDDMIVSGGENVFPAEIEDMLTSHDSVADAAVIGVPDPTYGHRLRAYVVRAEGASITEDEAKDYIKKNLARYEVPRDVVFIDEVPRNPTGKIVKRLLPE